MTEEPLTQDQRALLEQMRTPGTVLYGILSWMSDSIMLHHLLPLLADLVADAERAACVEPNDPCSKHWPSERHRWCEGCGLIDLADRVHAVARATAPTEHAPHVTGEPSATD